MCAFEDGGDNGDGSGVGIVGGFVSFVEGPGDDFVWKRAELRRPREASLWLA